MKKKIEDYVEYDFLDLETWLKIHYPKILIEYEKVKENLYIEE